MTTELTADAAADDADRLPWLEPVEDDEDERGPSPGKLIGAVLIGLVAIGIIVGGLFWLGNRAATTQEEVIASPGDYKVRPQDPGGMQVDDKASTQAATSAGTEPNATIDPNARPEAPVNQPRPAEPQAQPQPQPQQQAPAQAQAQPARLSGPTIQLGAYPSPEHANIAWSRLSQQHPALRSLQHAIILYQTGGRTFHRLRAAGGDAHGVCRRLQSSGTPCMIVPQ